MTPFLSNLGISAVDQQQSPTVRSFPRTLNPNCKLMWQQAIERLEPTDDPMHDWGQALRAYIRLCIKASQFPFSNLRQSANDQITMSLQNARRQVVKFMNLSKILKQVNIRKTRREVLMTSNGFTVTVFGNAEIKDPTFSKWLLQMPYPGFRLKDKEERYTKSLGQGITMVVYNEGANGSQRWHVGYEIVCNQFPDLPGKQLPSKGELESFILDIIWTPILKANRPYGFHRRLI